MKIDVTELMNRRSDEIKFDYTFDPEHTDVPADELAFLPEDVRIPGNGIRVTGICTDSLGCMMFRASVTVTYGTYCVKCLTELTETLEFDMERMILTDKIAGDRHLSDDNEWDGETDDVLYVNESRIIPDADIIEEISLEIPPFSLCSDDCPGLCPKCGKRLADGDCGCEEEKYVNEQFAILKKLLDNRE